MPILMCKCLTDHRCVYHGRRRRFFGISWHTSRGPEPRPRPKSFLPRSWPSRWPPPSWEEEAARQLETKQQLRVSQPPREWGAFGSARVIPLSFLGPRQGRKPGVTRLTEAPIKMSKHPACWVPASSPKREAFHFLGPLRLHGGPCLLPRAPLP